MIVWLSKVPLLTLNVETSDKHEELLFVVWFVWLCVTVQELCDCLTYTPVTVLTLCYKTHNTEGFFLDTYNQIIKIFRKTIPLRHNQLNMINMMKK